MASHSVLNADFRIDPHSPIPLYYQIRENLRDLIVSGRYAPGDAIPAERELSDVYNVNRLTVRRAVNELVSEGLLWRQQGVGTFVAAPKIVQTQPVLLGFTDRMLQSGHRPTSRVILQEEAPATGAVAKALHLTPNAPVVKLVRLRLADDEPIMLETSFMPQAVCPDLAAQDMVNQSLYRVLAERYGVQIVEAEEVVEPVALTDYEAELLGAQKGQPALLIEVTAFTYNGRPVEFGKSLVRGDKSRYHFRIHRRVEG
ncbi:MAG: phosphonate metabolism transcriptional regulator PhnF [Anaerolineae bacterium]